MSTNPYPDVKGFKTALQQIIDRYPITSVKIEQRGELDPNTEIDSKKPMEQLEIDFKELLTNVTEVTNGILL